MLRITTEQSTKYLMSRISEINAINLSLASIDYSIARHVGHKIRGSGTTFGYPEISALGIILEKAGIDQDKEQILLIIEKLKTTAQASLNTIALNQKIV